MTYDSPVARLTLNGRDLTSSIAPRLITLSLQEHRGDEADQLNIELSDADGLLEIPATGVVVALQIGWQGKPLIDKGTYTVDEAGHRGAPDVVFLRARSADLSGPLRTRTERSYHDTTIGSIVRDIARANGLEPVVDNSLDAEKVAHIDQTNESHLNFLTRIGRRYDAVATVKEGRLLFMRTQGGRTASGAELPTHQIWRRDGDRHDYSHSKRDAYSGVQASWQDPEGGRKRHVLVGVRGNAKQLRDTFASERDALAEAQAEWQRIRRGFATMRFMMAKGMPELSPQQKIRFMDMKPQISGVDWLIKSATHSLGDGGLVTSLDLELTDMPDDGGQVDG